MIHFQATQSLVPGQRIPYFAPLGKAKVGGFAVLERTSKHLIILPKDGDARSISANEYERVTALLPTVYAQDFDRSVLKTQNSSYIIAIEEWLRKRN
jgi:hypothetical protein